MGGGVTDERSVELWLVEKRARTHAVAAEGESLQNTAFISQGGAQFVNAINLHLPCLAIELNQHCSGISSA